MKLNRRDFLTMGALATGGLALGQVNISQKNDKKEIKNETPNAFIPKRKLGKLEVSALGLGCQSLGQTMYGSVPDRKSVVKLARTAVDYGVNFFDSAEVYGPFESEKVLGEALKSVRDKVVIATKFGWDIDPKTGQRTGKLNSQPKYVKKVVEGMLKRLQTDRIDLLYQHRFDPNVPIEDLAGLIQDLMKEGKVLHWGLSEANAETIRKAHAIQPLTAVQSEYSLLFRGREKDVLPVCEELGIGFVPWSPLGMAMLCGYVDEHTNFGTDRATDLRAIIPRFTPEAMKHNMQLVHLVQKWAKKKLCTPAQFSLAWLMAKSPSIVPIPGTSKFRHFTENIGACDVVFSAEELATFNTELEKITIVGKRLPDSILKFSQTNEV